MVWAGVALAQTFETKLHVQRERACAGRTPLGLTPGDELTVAGYGDSAISAVTVSLDISGGLQWGSLRLFVGAQWGVCRSGSTGWG